MVSGLPQPRRFWKLHLSGMGLFELKIYKVFKVFFKNSNPMMFQVGHFVLFCLFSVIDRYEWYWMGNDILLCNFYFYVGFFLLAYFASPGNSHCFYRGTVECSFSCIYFCEHIIIEKKLVSMSTTIENIFEGSLMFFSWCTRVFFLGVQIIRGDKTFGWEIFARISS